MEVVIVIFLVAVGPVALRFGADSRRTDDHGIFPRAASVTTEPGSDSGTPGGVGAS